MLRDGFAVLAVNVCGTGIAVAVHVLLAQLMGAAHYGIYVHALAWLSMLGLLSRLGMDTALGSLSHGARVDAILRR